MGILLSLSESPVLLPLLALGGLFAALAAGAGVLALGGVAYVLLLATVHR